MLFSRFDPKCNFQTEDDLIPNLWPDIITTDDSLGLLWKILTRKRKTGMKKQSQISQGSKNTVQFHSH